MGSVYSKKLIAGSVVIAAIACIAIAASFSYMQQRHDQRIRQMRVAEDQDPDQQILSDEMAADQRPFHLWRTLTVTGGRYRLVAGELNPPAADAPSDMAQQIMASVSTVLRIEPGDSVRLRGENRGDVKIADRLDVSIARGHDRTTITAGAQAIHVSLNRFGHIMIEAAFDDACSNIDGLQAEAPTGVPCT
jgi:hypothetical protein